MTTIKKILQWLSIVILFGIYMLYSYYFLRQQKGNTLVETINPVTYENHFDANKSQPNTFFTAPAFPEYTKWCDDEKNFCSIMPLQQLYADFQRLGSIQFVGWQSPTAIPVALGKLIDNITTLAPYWHYPYAFGQLIIPLQKSPDASKEMLALQKLSWQQAAEIAAKGEHYICDQTKITAIEKLDEDSFIRIVYNTGLKQAFLNPCPSYELPHYAAFNAFYYRWDAEDAAKNYKFSAFTEGSPGLTPLMAALVYWRGGEHLKGATLWYDRYLNITDSDTNDNNVLQNDADRAIKKAIFELQLQLISEAADIGKTTCDKSFTCLAHNGFIKQSIEKSKQQICNKKDNANSVRCILLHLGLQEGRITLAGNLTYPFGKDYIFIWSDDYNSRWIQPKQ